VYNMQKLITIDDIRDVRQVTTNIDDATSFDPYIIEAQKIDLQRLVGIKFFNIFMREIAITPTPPARATAILAGTEYELDEVPIAFEGIKPLLAYYAYARALPKLGNRVARFGVVKKVTTYSEPVEATEIADMVNDAKTNAKHHEEQLITYLKASREVYPEFFSTGKVGMIPAIRISAVGGSLPSYE
jgi:hypothetical protein